MTLLLLAICVSIKMRGKQRDVCETNFVVMHLDLNSLDQVSTNKKLAADSITETQIDLSLFAVPVVNFFENF